MKADLQRLSQFPWFGLPTTYPRGAEMIHGLKVVNNNGEMQLVCDCGGQAGYEPGGVSKYQLTYILVCRKCHKVLGTWMSNDERHNELRDFRKRLLGT